MYTRGTLVYILMGLFLFTESTDPTDECNPNPCKHGTCTDGEQSFTCTCDEGYTGNTCCANKDDCAANPCVHGECVDGIASYTCVCTEGYTGDTCDINIPDCEPNPCNDGNCTDGVNGYTCTCQEGLTGDCNIKKCYDSPTHVAYVGKYNKTESGIPCQRWDSDTPHSHGFNNPATYPDATVADAQNYCRDPNDDEGYLWCYTTDGNKRWESCGMGRCTCYTTDTAEDYAGTWNVTKTGRQCQRWDSDTPHSHGYKDASTYPDATLADAGNYCRDPRGGEGYLWCYTTDSNKRWESCAVDKCQFSWQTGDAK